MSVESSIVCQRKESLSMLAMHSRKHRVQALISISMQERSSSFKTVSILIPEKAAFSEGVRPCLLSHPLFVGF